MDTTFSMSRFLKVMKNEWSLTWKKMLLFWGVIAIIAVLFFVYLLATRNLIEMYSVFSLSYFLLLLLFGFYLRIYFREFASKKQTQSLLLLPASHGEQFWAKLLLGVIPYVVIALLFIVAMLEWAKIQNVLVLDILDLPATDSRVERFDDFYQQTTFLEEIVPLFSILWLLAASIFLFGMVSFKKWAPIKSIVLGFVAIVGLMAVLSAVFSIFSGIWTVWGVPGVATAIAQENQLWTVDFSRRFPIILFSFYIVVVLLLTFISRVKYNEKTI